MQCTYNQTFIQAYCEILVVQQPLKGTAMNFMLLFLFIAVGFNQRATNYSIKALAKIQRDS
jgi:hypothetical protein